MREDTFHLGIKGLIRNSSGQVLVLQINPAHLKEHRYHVSPGTAYWDLPGGRVEQGATVLDTLQRELAEELGVTEVGDIQPLGMVLSNIRIPTADGSLGLILSIYTCTIPADATIELSHEHIAAEWAAPKEAAKRLAIKYPPDFCQLIANL